jgi:hypothetical protein
VMLIGVPLVFLFDALSIKWKKIEVKASKQVVEVTKE